MSKDIQRVGDLFNRAAQLFTEQTGKTRLNIPDSHKLFINQIFERIIANYTGWRQAFPRDDDEYAEGVGAYKRELYESLVNTGIRDVDTLNRAFREMKRDPSDWLPKADRVAQFIRDARKQIEAEEASKRKRLPMKSSDWEAGKHQINVLRQKRARGELT